MVPFVFLISFLLRERAQTPLSRNFVVNQSYFVTVENIQFVTVSFLPNQVLCNKIVRLHLFVFVTFCTWIFFIEKNTRY